jgi:predicted HTH transcriptional regulator
VDKVGTGTEDIVNLCKDKGLKSPEYHQEEDFRVVIWRRNQDTGPSEGLIKDQVVTKLSPSCHQVVTKLSSSIPVIFELLRKMAEPMSAKEMREFCGQKDHTYFKNNVINPLIESGVVEMTLQNSPNSPTQRYRLTEAGKGLIDN